MLLILVVIRNSGTHILIPVTKIAMTIATVQMYLCIDYFLFLY